MYVFGTVGICPGEPCFLNSFRATKLCEIYIAVQWFYNEELEVDRGKATESKTNVIHQTSPSSII